MSNSGNTSMTHADLERLLDVYGSDRSRWPVEARAEAGQLVACDRAARRLLGEAEALDRVLERAPLPSLAREAALAERILAAAQRSPRMVRLDDAPVVGVHAKAQQNVISWPGARSRPRWLQMSDASRVAGLFAACLLFGIYVGLSNTTQGAIESMTGVGNGGSTTLALLDPLDEDLL